MSKDAQQHAAPAGDAVSPQTLPSVLVIAHSHPHLTRGGAEIAAYALFTALRDSGARAWFLGCSGPGSEQRLGAAITQPFGTCEYLYTPAAPFDYFKSANPDPHFPRAIGELVAALQPDIVHAHHYTRLGVEMFAVIKRARPATRIVLSLHEYLAICYNYGQMVKTGTSRLCSAGSFTACSQCFPEFSARDFFLRKQYVRMLLEDVDLFLAPSHFLAQRYIAWGLPAARVKMLENMPPSSPAGPAAAQELVAERLPPPGTGVAVPDPTAAEKTPFAAGVKTAMRGRSAAIEARSGPKTLAPVTPASRLPRSRTLRFGFFGQMSPLKGISVLIEAAALLAEMQIDTISIHIFGDYSHQPVDFQRSVRAALNEAGHNVVYHGPYENQDVQTLMRRVDAVIVPSIWWENSPLVIQEALASARPVMCSNIGGMAEKIRHGIDGLHFEAGSAASLAQLLSDLAERPEVLADLAATAARPLAPAAALAAHLEAYRQDVLF